MDAGSNESNSEKLKPWKEAEVSVSQGEEKLKSIRNMIYLLLGKIDSRRCNNRLMHVMEIDQSINHPHKILEVSRLEFSWGVFSPLLEAFSMSTYKESMTIKQGH
jgi:hypothetical protein